MSTLCDGLLVSLHTSNDLVNLYSIKHDAYSMGIL